MAFHHAAHSLQSPGDRSRLALLEILAANGPAMTLANSRVALSCRRAPRSDCLPSCSVIASSNANPALAIIASDLSCFELGSQAAAQFDFGDRAQPCLDRLMSSTGESVYLSCSTAQTCWRSRAPSRRARPASL